MLFCIIGSLVAFDFTTMGREIFRLGANDEQSERERISAVSVARFQGKLLNIAAAETG